MSAEDSLIYFRVIMLLEIIGGLSLWIYYYLTRKDRNGYAVGPIFLYLHALLFLILAAFNIIDKELYIIWRQFIIIHGLLIVLQLGIVELRTHKGRE